MSAASNTLRLILIGEDKSASKTVKGVGDEADKSGKKMQTFHKVGAAAGLALAGGLAVAGKAAFEMTKKAAEDQQAASRLAQTLHTAAGATKTQTAAVEDWITAQGKAVGVSDDELRPSLSKLVTATHDVGKAQKLASLAMDISAGTGRSLESVSFALAKAQNGNVSGLSRLGVQTSKTTGDTMALEKAQTAVKSAQLSYTAAVKAHGKGSTEASIAEDKLRQAHENVGAASEKTKKTTLSLDQITKNLANTYGGAAAKNAETAAGKQKIMQVQFQELQEQIGMGLIPVMSKLMTIGLGVVNWISNNTRTAGVLVGVLGSLLAITWAVSAATKAYAAISKVVRVAQILWTNAQWALNIAMEANPIGLVVVAIAALVVGMVIAYKKSATFRAIVQGAFHGILAAAHAVAGFFTHTIPAAFDAVKNSAKSAFNKVRGAVAGAFGWIKGNWPKILAVLTGPFGIAVLLIVRNFGKIKAAASATVSFIKSRFSDVVNFIRTIPGKIAALASNFLSVGKNLGSSIIHGLLDGLKAVGGMVGNLASAIKGAINSALHLPFTIKGPGPLPDFTIPAFARGGIVTGPTLAMVGDNPGGREAIVPLSGPNARSLGGTTEIHVHVSGLVPADEGQVIRKIESGLAKLKAQGYGRSPLAFQQG